MTASQSLKIYEILAAQFTQPEKARELTEAIEAAIERKTDDKIELFRSAMAKDFEILRSEIKEVKADLMRWMIGLFIPLYLSIIGLMVTILLKR